jgi:hypothetical protein
VSILNATIPFQVGFAGHKAEATREARQRLAAMFRVGEITFRLASNGNVYADFRGETIATSIRPNDEWRSSRSACPTSRTNRLA